MPNYFPVGYQPAYYQQYQQPQYHNNQMMQQPQQVQAQNQIPQQPQIHQSGFVRVQSENDARMYPVAPGNSVTFIDDNAPYCYVKTMDISQLDRPKFEKYRLVKEDDAQPSQAPQNNLDSSGGHGDGYALKSELRALQDELDALKEKIDAQATKKTTSTKKEDEINE